MKGERASIPAADQIVCETVVRVRFHEIDALGHVNNAAYLNYLEQAAIDHGALVGVDVARLKEFKGVFVAREHHVEFLRPSFAGDVLRIFTWLEEPTGAVVVRRYLIYRRGGRDAPTPLHGWLVKFGAAPERCDLVVSASTSWAFVSEGGMPKRIPAAVMDAFRER